MPKDTHGRTGNYTGGPASNNADKIIQLMQIHDLVAANTFFAPKRNGSVHTFLRTKRKDEGINNPAPIDHGQHVGKTVFTKYKGKTIKGEVRASHAAVGGTQSWTV